MEQKDKERQCALCGYAAEGKFVGDICPGCNLTFWRCQKCGYTITAPIPPDICPECNEIGDFRNISCYTPECGGPGHIDPRL
jgi:rubrerythrin